MFKLIFIKNPNLDLFDLMYDLRSAMFSERCNVKSSNNLYF
ncbi:MAG: hypothetical protein KatS3mg035_1743 [Bacteroidia bacterium]|nr:MAG: hypothetical protein KatS3mg035_1743 [Bacteroidia bacterium]